MGEAKRRKAEIRAIKAANNVEQKLVIMAIRHCKDGNPEVTSFHTTYIPKNAKSNTLTTNEKSALLKEICRKNWGHAAPAKLITLYLLQTQAFKFFSQIDNDRGFVINFYECDPDSPNGGSYSCRDIIAMPSDAVMDYAKEYCDNLAKNNPEYSVLHRDKVH